MSNVLMNQKNSQMGGAFEYSNQIGMIHPGPKTETVVTGYQYSDLGSPLEGGKKSRRRRSSSKSKSKKSTKKSTRRRSMRGGAGLDFTGLSPSSLSNSAPVSAESQKNTIPLDTLASPDWVNKGQPQGPPPYAADLSVGVNEYQFGRTTPSGQFVVATGLVPKGPGAIEMIGAGKKKRKSSSSSKSKTKSKSKSKSKKSTAGVVFNKTKSVITTVGDVVIKTVQYIGKKTSNTVKSISKKK